MQSAGLAADPKSTPDRSTAAVAFDGRRRMRAYAGRVPALVFAGASDGRTLAARHYGRPLHRKLDRHHQFPCLRARIDFIRAISSVWDRTMPSQSERISGSVKLDRSHIKIAPEWCGIIERRNWRSSTSS